VRLLASTALVLACYLPGASPVWAIDECGSGSPVTCTSASNNYPNGISYDPVTDLTMVIEGDGVITPNSGISGIDIDSSSAAVDLSIQNGAYISTTGASAQGIDVNGASSIILSSEGATIKTSGDLSQAIYLTSTSGDVSFNLSGINSIETSSVFAAGINVRNTSSDVTLTVSADSTIQTNNQSSRSAMNSAARRKP
jgi:hypothetical protein